MTKQIILIGGMPTAGKSTLAEKLSKHLNVPYISSDQIGTIMRGVASRDQYPALFTWEDYDGFKYLSQYTADEIADNEFVKSEAVWLGIRKFIKEDFTWDNGFIVEGDDILPHLVAQDFSDSGNVKAVFIGDRDTDRVRDVVFTRNFSGGDATTYPDSIKEKEVEWVLNYGEKLKVAAEKHGFAWIEVEKNVHDLAKILTVLGLSQ